MKKGKAAYPAVEHSKVERLKLVKKHLKNYVPCYILIDADGNFVAEGKSAALAKIAEL